MDKNSFNALVVREVSEGKFIREIAQRQISDLPVGEVLIRVKYSSLNYKDALSASGHKGVTKKYPHTPGVDAAGIVEESRSSEFKLGEEVIVTGFDLGMNTSGGFGQYIRVPAGWVIKRPEKLSLKECMIYGTAGFTAALSLWKLEKNDLNSSKGDVLVTGATGGVGSMAVAILSKAGYSVSAVTGKAHERDYLLRLGAKEVISREEMDDKSGKVFLKERWAAVIDTVGGNILTTALKSTKFGGSVTCCGMITSNELKTAIFPFILKGINLLGIASAETPLEIKKEIWERLSRQWKIDSFQESAQECSLGELNPKIDMILKGQIRGRVFVDLEN
ncbi:MAG: YhdH/YhfP family quinone oxidoreductase [Candidatus Omnitrophota bacterium]